MKADIIDVLKQKHADIRIPELKELIIRKEIDIHLLRSS